MLVASHKKLKRSTEIASQHVTRVAERLDSPRAGIFKPGWRSPMDLPSISEQTDRPYISTGHLPEPDMVQKLVADAHRRFKSNGEGHNSQVYPALARVPRELFGVCVVGTSGRVYEAGDTEHNFSIMSVSKPFVFALVCE